MDWHEWQEQDWAKELSRRGYAVPPIHPDDSTANLKRIMDRLKRKFPEQCVAPSEQIHAPGLPPCNTTR
jgi:hypothetical protein